MSNTKEFDVHFQITGFYQITAENEEEARKITNDIINEKINDIESDLKTGLYDDDYIFEVIKLDCK